MGDRRDFYLLKFSFALVLLLSGCQRLEEVYLQRRSSSTAVEGARPTATLHVVALVPTSSPEPIYNPAIAVPTFTLESQSPTKAPILPTPTRSEPGSSDDLFYQVGESDLIVFASNLEANRDIYITYIKTEFHWPRTLRRLTDYYGEDTLPDLGPDGTTVAFVSDRSGNRDIYLVDVETLAVDQLTHNFAQDSNPAWSANGEEIVFQSNRDGNNEIYIIDVDCAKIPEGCPDEVVRVTNSNFDDLEPEWSPDDGRIAFMSARDGNLEIYVMNTDGTAVTRLTDNPGVDGFPSWSPDGSMLAYHSERDGYTDIYIMTLDGQQEWRVTESRSDQMAPYWCGNSIVYMSRGGNNFSIVITKANHQGPIPQPYTLVRSATTNAFDGFPSCGRPGSVEIISFP